MTIYWIADLFDVDYLLSLMYSIPCSKLACCWRLPNRQLCLELELFFASAQSTSQIKSLQDGNNSSNAGDRHYQTSTQVCRCVAVAMLSASLCRALVSGNSVHEIGRDRACELGDRRNRLIRCIHYVQIHSSTLPRQL